MPALKHPSRGHFKLTHYLPGLERVLSMARAQHQVICADLGSQFDPLSMALLQESRRIFLVTTPEVISLHLPRMRLHRLTELGLHDRVSLLLNRKVQSKVKDSDVDTAVGIPVSHSFSNDYQGVQDAILRASRVPQGSELGESILNFRPIAGSASRATANVSPAQVLAVLPYPA